VTEEAPPKLFFKLIKREESRLSEQKESILCILLVWLGSQLLCNLVVQNLDQIVYNSTLPSDAVSLESKEDF
jgi:hypothetical protein